MAVLRNHLLSRQQAASLYCRLGVLPLNNEPSNSWSAFFVENRLRDRLEVRLSCHLNFVGSFYCQGVWLNHAAVPCYLVVVYVDCF